MSYDIVSGDFQLFADGEVHVEKHCEFPNRPPLLGLLAPLVLPIWGGSRSFCVPLEVHDREDDRIYVAFGYAGDVPNGSALIDLHDYATDELLLKGVTYARIDDRPISPLHRRTAGIVRWLRGYR